MPVAIVTGASSGIGAVFARRLAAQGSDLVLVARRVGRLEALADELRRDRRVAVETLAADLAQPADLARVAGRAGQDDVALLVNNAGVSGYGPFAEVDPAVLAQVLALNVTAPTVLARAALPGMLAREDGAIVNVASLLAFAGAVPPGPLPVRAAYAGTKGYLVTFSRTLAAELAGTPVRVQVLCPGYTATEFHLAGGIAPVEGTAPADQPNAIAPEDVVEASLVALAGGEVVCVPSLEDASALDRLVAAEARMRAGDRTSALAARYAVRRGGTGRAFTVHG
jgi:short-subunit dehydrogenase